MKPVVQPLDLGRVQVFPLAERRSLTRVEDVLVQPDLAPPACASPLAALIEECARQIRRARQRQASIILMYGAHLLRNGAALILEQMMTHGWLTHLATNGAGAIHDWEFAWLGRSTESVEQNVATGTFGAWDETGRSIHLALLAGGAQGEGFGAALGRFVAEDGVTLPSMALLEAAVRSEPQHLFTPARAELLLAMHQHRLPEGRIEVRHPWKQASVLAQAFRQKVPLTVHPGIGYDIIANHPMFNGAAIGRAAAVDFRWFGGAVEQLDGGVVLAIGSAIMAPQVFEKSLSCVNNLRRQAGRARVEGHTIYVVDLQDGGCWDWSQGEPPKDHPAYYLRFCKSFSRMGGAMRYLQCDNMIFLRRLWHQLQTSSPPTAG